MLKEMRAHALVALGIMFGVVWSGGCGGGGSGSSDAAPPQSGSVSATSHVSSLDAGPFSIPAGSPQTNIAAAFSFTPADASDVPLLFQLEGEATMIATASAFVALEIRDANGTLVARGAAGLTEPATASPFLISTAMVNGNNPTALPLTAYTINVVAWENGGSADWSLANVRVRVVILGNVESVSPSPNIS